MPTSKLLYKTGMSSEGTRHLMLPGADLPLCGVDVVRVFPGIGGKELETTEYCGNCTAAGKSNENKFRRPEPVKPTPPTPPTPRAESLGRVAEDEKPRTTKKSAPKKKTSSKKKG